MEFGVENHENTFLDLVSALDKVDGISRIRISSVEPNLLSNDIIDFVSTSNKFVPHFHIPMQSGSDSVLKLMKRRYLSKLYKNRIDHIKKVIPNVCIGADVIVGFPGETEEDFQILLDWLDEAELDRVGCFKYSPVEGAKANDLPDHVPEDIQQERWDRFMAKQQEISTRKLARRIGQRMTVLIDEVDEEGA